MNLPAIESTTIDALRPLTAGELAHACGAGVDWVIELVDIGIIESRVPSEVPQLWRFHGSDLGRALMIMRLERDFGTNLDASALIVEMQFELRRLKGVLIARGLEREI